jgi:hypothetical protein
MGGALTNHSVTEEKACELLQELASKTWSQIGSGERVGIKIGEESLTDLLLLELANRFPHPTKVKKWSRREEGRRTGADWDWWFTDRKFRTCVGLRIQAKRIDYFNQKFTGFDAANAYGPQRLTLRQSSALEGLHPLYCLYIASPNPPNEPSLCPSAGESKSGLEVKPPSSLFGCSLIGLDSVEKSLAARDQTLSFLWADLLPWSCLTCCEAIGPDLISRVDAQALRLSQSRDRKLRSLITDNLPPEVIALMDGDGLGARSTPPDVGATVVTVVDGD